MMEEPLIDLDLGVNGTTVLSAKMSDGTIEEFRVGPDSMRTLIELIDGLAWDAGIILGVPLAGDALPQLVQAVNSMRCAYPEQAHSLD